MVFPSPNQSVSAKYLVITFLAVLSTDWYSRIYREFLCKLAGSVALRHVARTCSIVTIYFTTLHWLNHLTPKLN